MFLEGTIKECVFHRRQTAVAFDSGAVYVMIYNTYITNKQWNACNGIFIIFACVCSVYVYAHENLTLQIQLSLLLHELFIVHIYILDLTSFIHEEIIRLVIVFLHYVNSAADSLDIMKSLYFTDRMVNLISSLGSPVSSYIEKRALSSFTFPQLLGTIHTKLY